MFTEKEAFIHVTPKGKTHRVGAAPPRRRLQVNWSEDDGRQPASLVSKEDTSSWGVWEGASTDCLDSSTSQVFGQKNGFALTSYHLATHEHAARKSGKGRKEITAHALVLQAATVGLLGNLNLSSQRMAMTTGRNCVSEVTQLNHFTCLVKWWGSAERQVAQGPRWTNQRPRLKEGLRACCPTPFYFENTTVQITWNESADPETSWTLSFRYAAVVTSWLSTEKHNFHLGGLVCEV